MASLNTAGSTRLIYVTDAVARCRFVLLSKYYCFCSSLFPADAEDMRLQQKLKTLVPRRYARVPRYARRACS